MSINILPQLNKITSIRKFFVFLVLLVFNLTLVFTQSDNLPADLKDRMAPKITGTIYQKVRNYPGSELLSDTWCPGSILLFDSSVVEKQMLNYDAFSDELLLNQINNISVVVSKYQVKSFVIENRNNTHKFDLVTTGENSQSYFEVLYGGNLKLYASRRTKINNTLLKDNTFGESVYYLETEYFLLKNGSLISVNHNKHFFYSIFGKPQVKNLIRANNLKIKDESDMAELIKLLDTSVKTVTGN